MILPTCKSPGERWESINLWEESINQENVDQLFLLITDLFFFANLFAAKRCLE